MARRVRAHRNIGGGILTVDYRGKVRDRDPETSWNAAGKQDSGKVDLVKGIIHLLLMHCGEMTDEQLVREYNTYCSEYPSFPRVTPQSVRTRRAALVREGRVINTNTRGRTALGNTATIWKAV